MRAPDDPSGATGRARREGIRRFTALVSADNAAIAALLRNKNAELTGRGAGTVEYQITLAPGDEHDHAGRSGAATTSGQPLAWGTEMARVAGDLADLAATPNGSPHCSATCWYRSNFRRWPTAPNFHPRRCRQLPAKPACPARPAGPPGARAGTSPSTLALANCMPACIAGHDERKEGS